ncbi:para-nitrobenzyl esterase [Staphylococcus nepalensis]|uniref:Carboxylic ester hydrolase n=2 Tax=Staphylococcus nepalensis TaxID=214473 RepID=A0A2T4S9C7_9STAP|nr:para-nitrobenzyl esterase [Staphylococcus nepalensis]
MMQIQIEQGTIEGILNDSIYKFLGLPYAEAPVKERRWREPSPPKRWKGVYKAIEFGPVCPQKGGASFDLRTLKQSEDCLYINVWTSDTDKIAQQPVMVWIHGGGNLGGAGSEDAFDGAELAKQGVTVVTFNYRLGAFGFLAHPNIGCNFAVLDQVAALKWVTNNIEYFGGNPNNVTIFGESAGAQAVRNLLSVKRAKGLFHRAIIQSAGFEPYVFASEPTYEKVENVTVDMLNKLGSSDLESLQQLSTDTVLEASTEFSGVFPPPGEVHTPANLIWNPVPDGDIVAKQDWENWNTDIPILIGCVENEARYFIKPDMEYSVDTLSNMITALTEPVSDRVRHILKADNLTTYEALDKLFTTAVWFEPCYATVKRFEKLGHNIYYYHFSRVSPVAHRTKELAKHTSEIRYIFGNLNPKGDYDEKDITISKALQHAWVSFARNGIPSNKDSSLWPRYDSKLPYMTLIKNEILSCPIELTSLTRTIHSLRV